MLASGLPIYAAHLARRLPAAAAVLLVAALVDDIVIDHIERPVED
jgi:hypothetical protein